MSEKEKKEAKQISRRRFLKGGGIVVGGAAATATIAGWPRLVRGDDEKSCKCDYPASQAYLVVDSMKCAGCLTCMLTCSMVHDKKASLSSSRIQIFQTPLLPFPEDLMVYQCRQCTDPLCVENCPAGACKIDGAHGNVRVVDQSKCIGCGTCLEMCPHPAHRTIWDGEKKKATKCDLCADAPYFSKPGGSGPQQACVLACPMGALSVVTQTPDQTDDTGYDVNLRKKA
jgi:protein NrfC